MSLLKRICINIWSLLVWSVITLWFFYTFYDSDSLTADVLQQQLEKESRPELVMIYESGQINVFLNKDVVSGKEIQAEFVMVYDDSLLAINESWILSEYPVSYTTSEWRLIVELQLDAKMLSDQKLFSIDIDGGGWEWLSDQIVMTSAKFLIDGELETFAIGNEIVEWSDSERLH